MKVALKQIQDEITVWWEKQTYRGKAIILLLGILVIVLCFICPEPARNLILLTAGIVGWYFLNRRTITAEKNTEAAEQSAKTAEKVLTTEQITRAVEQLTHEKSSVRMGGVLGLGQVAATQEEERMKIARILVSFIRTRARRNSKETEKDLHACNLSKLKNRDDFSAYRLERLDVESAVNTLANIALEFENRGEFEKGYESKKSLCDLRNTDLRGLKLDKIDLSIFNLVGTDFSGAWLPRANFTKANISSTRQEDITKFTRAWLPRANFSDARLLNVDFSSSNLSRAIFDKANLRGAIFRRCIVSGTRFESSKNLTKEQIDEADRFGLTEPPTLPEGLHFPTKNP